MGGGYEQVGSAEDVTNVNPMTGDILQILMGELQAGGQGAEQVISSMQNFDFLGILDDPRLQGLLSDFEGKRGGLAELAAEQAERQISGSFAGTGLYSGAFGEAVGAGVGQAYQAGATDIAGKRADLFGQAMGVAGQQQGQQLGFYGQQAGGAMAGLSGMGMPEWYEPFYGYTPGAFETLSGFSPLALIPFM